MFDHVDSGNNSSGAGYVAWLSVIGFLVAILAFTASLLAYGTISSGYFLVVALVGVALAYSGYRLGRFSSSHPP